MRLHRLLCFFGRKFSDLSYDWHKRNFSSYSFHSLRCRTMMPASSTPPASQDLMSDSSPPSSPLPASMITPPRSPVHQDAILMAPTQFVPASTLLQCTPNPILSSISQSEEEDQHQRKRKKYVESDIDTITVYCDHPSVIPCSADDFHYMWCTWCEMIFNIKIHA